MKKQHSDSNMKPVGKRLRSETRHSYDVLKRIIDLVVAAVLLIITAPLQGVLSILVWRDMGRPVIFTQTRPGRGREPFKILKFRSMRSPDPSTDAMTDADRLTALGRVLRLYSLDELPSLLNVVRGDMSLVGPRPLLEKYSDFFTEEESERFDVRPGITGLAQVRGRNVASWDQRLAFDVEYVRLRSLYLDARILGQTLINCFKGADVVVDPSAVMLDLDVERSSERSV